MVKRSYEIGMCFCLRTCEYFSVIVEYIGRISYNMGLRRISQIYFSSSSLSEDKWAKKIM